MTHRRHLRDLSLATVVCAVLAATAMPAAWAEDTILARGWTHENYGRLVLDTGSAELTDVSATGDAMVITFKRPVNVNMVAAVSNLRPYLLSASPSADGKQLTLRLRQAISYRHFDNNGNLVIDLATPGSAGFAAVKPAAATSEAAKAEPGKPQAAQASSTPASSTAAPAAPAPASLIQARSGEHNGYSRLAFDLPQGTTVTFRGDGDRAVLRLIGPANLDLNRLQQRLPVRIQSISARAVPGGQIVDLRLKPGTVLRDTQQGRTVVLDLYDPAKAPAEGKSSANRLPADPQSLEQLAAAGAAQQATAQEAAPQASGADPVGGLVPLTAMPEAPRSGQTAQAQTNQAAQPAVTMSSATSVTLPSFPALPAAEAPATPPAAVNVPVTVAPGAGGGAILSFQWASSVPMAAFRREDALWLVFGAPAQFGSDAFSAAPLAALGHVEPLDSKYAAGLRLTGAQLPTPAIRKSGNTWIVELAPANANAQQKGTPDKALPQRRETLAQGGSSLLLQADNPGAVVSFTDPRSGDRLQIAPLPQPGLGVAEQAAWPEFKLLPSYQGVVVAPLADNVSVQPLPNGVVVTTFPASQTKDAQANVAQAATGAVSGNGASPANALAGQAAATDKGGGAMPAQVAGLFDLPSWRRGGEAAFLKDRDILEEAITSASPETRNTARLSLAQFLFAHGLVPEAAGMLDLISRDRGGALANKLTLTLAGAAHALNGDVDQADKLLNDPLVGNSPEASLFRGVLAARKGDNAAASKFFDESLPELKHYPKPLRIQLGLTIIRSQIDGGNPMASQAYADAMRRDMPDAETTDRLTYLDGLRQLKMGRKDDAIATWEALKNSSVEDVRAQSQFAVVSEKLRNKQMTPQDAIQPLEDLRFLSRGGDFEFGLLRKLGEVYLAADRPRKGLLTLRQAVTNFPNRPESKDIAQEMSDAFRHLYMDGGADRLTPLTAVALYDEFRELTPSGPDGDKMIANLSDRLVKVDLLDGAANVLEPQVKHRLSGVDKARAGARLAAIRLLDNKPDLAAQALADSQISDPLPDDLAATRQRLQSQADFGAGQTLKALEEIKDDDSLPARWQRADMLWQLQEWPAAANALGKLVEGEEDAIARRAGLIMAKNNVAIDPAAALRETLATPAQASGAQPASAAADSADANAGQGPVTFTDVMGQLRTKAFKERLGQVVLNQAVALSLAGDRRGLRGLARDYGKDMAQTDLAKSFAMLTSPSNGLAESVSAEMASVDQIGSFVDEYRRILRQASLSEPALTN